MCGCSGGTSAPSGAPTNTTAATAAPVGVVLMKHTHFFWFVLAFALGLAVGHAKD